jgi:hypothetical protein
MNEANGNFSQHGPEQGAAASPDQHPKAVGKPRTSDLSMVQSQYSGSSKWLQPTIISQPNRATALAPSLSRNYPKNPPPTKKWLAPTLPVNGWWLMPGGWHLICFRWMALVLYVFGARNGGSVA